MLDQNKLIANEELVKQTGSKLSIGCIPLVSWERSRYPSLASLFWVRNHFIERFEQLWGNDVHEGAVIWVITSSHLSSKDILRFELFHEFGHIVIKARNGNRVFAVMTGGDDTIRTTLFGLFPRQSDGR